MANESAHIADRRLIDVRFAILLGTLLGASHGWVSVDQHNASVDQGTWQDSVPVVTFWSAEPANVRFQPY